jgi:hypothetical protein
VRRRRRWRRRLLFGGALAAALTYRNRKLAENERQGSSPLGPPTPTA